MKKIFPLNGSFNDQPLFLSLPCSGNSKEITIMPASQVLYVQSKHDHICCIVAQDEMRSGYFIKSVMNKDIGYFCELLPKNIFIHIHRSYLVNINFIRAYNKTDYIITMADKTVFSVAYRHRKDFKDIIHL